MSAQRQHVDSQLIEVEPILPKGTGLIPTDNPYLAMAQQALALGKVDQLDKLLDLQLRWDAEQARKEFVAAMAAFKAEPMEILKRKLVAFETRDGDTTSYRHAELSDVAEVVVPAMGKHGLSHRWNVQQEGGQITVTCIVTHAAGHSETVGLTAAPDASGKKNAIQQVASTVTYLERYTLLMATGMATKGMDDDGRSSEADTVADPEYLTDEQAAVLNDLLNAYVMNKPKFLSWVSQRVGYTVENLADLTTNFYQPVYDALVQLRAERTDA